MAIHKRKDFAVLCGLEPRELSVYSKRKKVIIVNGMVDDENALNAEFLAKHSTGEGQKVKINIIEKEPSKGDLKKIKEAEEYTRLSSEKRKLENEVLTENIHLLRMKKQKMEGVLIPTELVRKIFEQHFRSITISFQRGAENVIIEISKKKSLPVRRQQNSGRS